MKTVPSVPRIPLKLPLFLSEVPAGFPSPADDYVETTLDLERLLVKHPSATYFVRARGDSMSTVIETGDLLIVDRSLEPRDRHIVLASLYGELTVKYLRKRSGKVYLVPKNEKYPPIDVTEVPDFQFFGVVTAVVRDTCTRS
jgi:DNA polymerase V